MIRRVRLWLFAVCLAGFVFAALAVPASGQFIDKTTSRFPQPDPNDYTNQAAVADIDNDGDLDIIWANGGNFGSPGPQQLVRVYVNNGNGVFADETIARTGGLVGHIRGAEFGDIEQDGDLDLILCNDFNQQPRLLVNDGNGFFTDETAARLPSQTLSSTRAQFGDFDNDGDLDIYINNGGTSSRFGCGQNRIWINTGSGFFVDQTASRHPTDVRCEPMDVIFGDVDGDFDIDVRTASTGSGQSRLYINDGSGTFSIGGGVPNDNNCYSYDFGDIDGDGDLDLLGANANPTSINAELLLRNNGIGGYTNVSAQIVPNPNVDDNDSKFYDYDMDGDLDLFVARLGGSAERIYNNNGSGLFTEVTGLITSVSDSSLDIVIADFDNDGRADIITAQGESGSFVNRYYQNIGAVDNRPPRIIDTEMLSNTNDTVGPYVVRAAILDDLTYDRNFFDRGVTLHYSVNGGAEQTVPMHHSGGQIYRGEIPGQPCGGAVTYHVTARDWADNVGSGGTNGFNVVSDTPSPAGDINGDCSADLADVPVFVDVLLGVETDPARVDASDLDDSGAANGADIAPFIAALKP